MNKVIDALWKSLVVGAVYVIALVLGGILVDLIGLSLPEAGNEPARLLWLFMGGVIAGLFLGPISSSMRASRSRHLLVWGSVIFFNIASVTIEGRFFAPEMIGTSLPGLLIQQILAALATGWSITTLFAPKETITPIAPVRRHWFQWAWRFVVSALSYVVFYFIFGALNYAFVTKHYYETHAHGLTVPSPQTVLTVELIRAPLIVLSVLPFVLTLRAAKTRLALLTGLILFAIGGLVPLTMQASALPLLLLVASAVEIFFQNFSTGLVTARFLGRTE